MSYCCRETYFKDGVAIYAQDYLPDKLEIIDFKNLSILMICEVSGVNISRGQSAIIFTTYHKVFTDHKVTSKQSWM